MKITIPQTFMTPDERFAQIESILLQNTSQSATLLEGQIKLQEIQQQQHAAHLKVQEAQLKTQEQLTEFNRDTCASIDDLVDMVMASVIQGSENASFIKGLQVENRRMLRELRDHRRDNP